MRFALALTAVAAQRTQSWDAIFRVAVEGGEETFTVLADIFLYVVVLGCGGKGLAGERNPNFGRSVLGRVDADRWLQNPRSTISILF